MGIIENMKAQAKEKRVVIQTSEEERLTALFNKMFFMDKNVKEETIFLKTVMTRGAETQERKGLHASALIVSDQKFCERQQVLSLMYKQKQGEQYSATTMRVFEEGNAIHEKWQRLFIRAGYGSARDMDRPRMCKEFEVEYTPDADIIVPDFGEYVVEIKSARKESYYKVVEEGHAAALKQIQLYMWLERKKKGIVLVENKNDQEFRLWVVRYEKEAVRKYVERMRKVKECKGVFDSTGRLPMRKKCCKSSMEKEVAACPMGDACFDVGSGRVALGDDDW